MSTATSRGFASTAPALLIAAAILYIPANLLPIVETSSPFGTDRDTIASGVVHLWRIGAWPLAVLIFAASIVIPLVKLLALGFLLVSVHIWKTQARPQRARLYRFIAGIGRWSMVDIFAAAILAELVRFSGAATVTIGPGAAAFAAVVVLTLMATHAFDPRLIWNPEVRKV